MSVTSTPDSNITTWTIGNPTFKMGVLSNVDLEVNFSAYNSVQTNIRSTGMTTRAAGFGDVVTRTKINLFGNDGGSAALALMPYGKCPTAPQGIGNQFVEGGMAVPLAVALPGGFTTILMGQIDVLKNPTDNAYHLNFPAMLNLNRQIFPGVTAYAELYANWSTHREVQ